MGNKVRTLFMIAAMSCVSVAASFSQTWTLECYVQEPIHAPDCSFCIKPGQYEVYTGLIAQKISGGDTTRTKLYYPYQINIRPNDVLINDQFKHTAFFPLSQAAAQFPDTAALLMFLRMCHFEQKVTTYRISSDTIYFQLSGDSLRFVKFPPGFTDTDDQKIDTAWFDDVLDSFHIKLENDPRTWGVYINLSSITGSDKQRFDRFERIGDTLYASIQRDSVVDYKVNLKFPDADSQSLYVPNVDSIGITRGNRIKIIENQYFDTAGFVGNIFRLSIKDDNMPYTDIDFSPYLDNINQTYSHTRLTNYYQNDLSNGGGQWTLNVIGGLALTGTGGNISLAALDISPTNEVQTLSGAITSGEAFASLNAISGVGGGTIRITPAGILTITGSGNNWTFTVTEVDGSTNNEGIIGVGAGGGTSSTLISNTTGQNPITINYAGILSGTESTATNGGSITLTATEVQVLNSVSRVTTLTGGTSFAVNPGPGVSITQGGTAGNATYLFSATDTSASNELQGFNASGLTVGLTQSSTSIELIAGTNTSIISGGTASNSTYTINATSIDTQRVLVFARHGDTVMIKLTNDTLNKFLLPPTDTQKVLIYTRHGDTAMIRLTNDTLRSFLLPHDSLSLSNDSIGILLSNKVSLKKYIDTARIQLYYRSGDTLYIKLVNDSLRYLVLPPVFVDTDTDSQSLFIEVDSLHISRGNAVSLLKYLDNTDSQKVLRFQRIGDTVFLRISNDTTNFILLPTFVDTDTDSQSLSITSLDSLHISRGNSVSLLKYIDTARIESYYRIGDSIYVKLYNDPIRGIKLPVTDTQRVVRFQRIGDSVFIKIDNDTTRFIILPTGFVDTDTQSLSIQGDSLAITRGNKVYLPKYIDTARIESYYRSNDSIYIKLYNDPIRSIKLPADINTDSQSVSLVVDSLGISRGNKISLTKYIDPAQDFSSFGNVIGLTYSLSSVELNPGPNITITPSGTALNKIYTIASSFTDTNTDSQSLSIVVDSLKISRGNAVYLGGYHDPAQDFSATGLVIGLTLSTSAVTLANGSNINIVRTGSSTNPTYTINSSFTNTDSQSLYIPHIDSLSITRGNTVFIDENQWIDTLSFSGNILGVSVSGDRRNQNTVDLSSLSDPAQTLSTVALTTSISITGSSVTYANGTFMNIVQTGTAGAATLTFNNTMVYQNLSFIGSGPTYNLNISNGTGTTVTQGGGILLSRSANDLKITAIDSSATNELDVWQVGANGSYINVANADQVNFLAAGIASVSRATRTITYTVTEAQVLNSVSLVTTLSGGSSVKDSAGLGISIIQTGTAANAVYTFTATDNSITNEIQHYNASGLVIGLTQSTSTITLANGSNINIVMTGTASNPIYTFNSTFVNTDSQSLSLVVDSLKISRGNAVSLAKYIDPVQVIDTAALVGNIFRISLSLDNEGFKGIDFSQFIDAPQTLSTIANIMSLSLSGGSVQYIGNGLTIATGGTALNSTLTFTPVDGSISNEGLIGVGAGTSTSFTITSNTSTQIPITFNVNGILTQTETPGANGGIVNLSVLEAQTLNSVSLVTSLTGSTTNSSIRFVSSTGLLITQYGTALDAAFRFTALDSSATNEAQPWTGSGTTNYVGTLGAIGGVGGGSVTINGSTGVKVNHSSNVVTLTASDSSATNELQNLSGSGLTVSLSQSSSTFSFVAGANTTITSGGTSANPTYTFASTASGTQHLLPYITTDTIGAILTASNDTLEFVFVAGSGGGGGSSGTMTSMGYVAGPRIGITGPNPVTTSGVWTISNLYNDGDSLNTNEGVLTATDGTLTTKLINSSGGGSSSFSAITLGVSGIMGISRSANTINFSATEAQTLSIVGTDSIRISGTNSTVKIPGTGAANLTWGVATTTKDTLLSSTGTDAIIQVDGTLRIDSSSNNLIRITNNRFQYTATNLTTSTASPGVTITGSTSQTLAINSQYVVRYYGYAINSTFQGAGIAIRSSVPAWTGSGIASYVISTGGITANGQQSFAHNPAASGVLSGNPFFVKGEYYVKTNATPGTISFQGWSTGGNATFSDIKIEIEKLQ